MLRIIYEERYRVFGMLFNYIYDTKIDLITEVSAMN